MKQQYISRGSQWRKWDLHVHTKDTVKNDQFNDSETFDEFCVTMFKKAIENGIFAIGITDYFNIKNYLRVKEFVANLEGNNELSDDEKSKIKEIFLLPNVELRMLPVTDSGRLINIHCLFNPDYADSDSLEHDFFAQLESYDCLMTEQGIRKLGRNIKPNANDDSVYQTGVDNFVVDYRQLGKLLKVNQELRKNTIVVVSNSSDDGASGLQEHYTLFVNEPGALDATREAIYKMSDAIFSSNLADREFFLGKKPGYDANHVRQKCGSLKPCIHGSDAHTEEKLFRPYENRYCWIKADLTFDGLKQILYEPEDRVIVQEVMPESKRPYNLIDKVKFVDDDFMEDEICLSQNLTAIIGGKSTGKSRLLGSIAQHIDPDEVAERISHTLLNDRHSLRNDDIADKRLLSAVDGFEATWANAQANDGKKITYIPQSYLNKLVDAADTKSGIHAIIEKVIKQKCPEIYSKLVASTSKVEQRIAVKITELFVALANLNQRKDELRNTGNRNDVEADIASLQSEIAELSANSGLIPEEIQQHKKLSGLLDEAKRMLRQTESDISHFRELREIEIILSEHQLSLLSSDTQEAAHKKYSDIQTAARKEWSEFVDEQLRDLENRKNSIISERDEFAGEIAPLARLMENSSLLMAKKRTLDEQQIKQNNINTLEKSIEANRKSAGDTCRELLRLVQEFHQQHDEARRLIDEQVGDLTTVKIVTKVSHKMQSFQDEFLVNFFDRRMLPEKWKEYKCDENGFHQDVECVLRDVINAKMKLKSGHSKKDAVTALLKNWCELTYDINADGDVFARMSPGKKAFVLLECIVQLDNSEYPLLLDQPDDDLDNRTIYKELVKFIKDKKKARQIIIVTHNPNLVIGADAECIIVANQRGDRGNGQEHKFEYVSGAIENTFPEQGTHPLRNQGIREHVCAILEGGDAAFKQREKKYGY